MKQELDPALKDDRELQATLDGNEGTVITATIRQRILAVLHRWEYPCYQQ